MRVSLAALVRRLRPLKRQGRKVVFTNGCFDLIHAGHVRLLRQARRAGGVLVVAVNSDASVRRLKGEGRPILPLKERMEILDHLNMVDFVVSFPDATPLRLIQKIQPDVLIKGGDYCLKKMAGSKEVISWNGRVVSGLFVKGKSTSGIIRKIRKIPKPF